jgi:hypothetical protein
MANQFKVQSSNCRKLGYSKTTAQDRTTVVSQKQLYEHNILEKQRRLCRYSEDLMDEGDLSPDIPFFHIFNLTLADHIHRLKASDGETSRVE